MSTFKDARTFLLESPLDVVIDDDEFILLCDETLLKKPKFPYELFFIFTWHNDIKIQEYRNNKLNYSSATSMLLMSVSIPPVFFFLLFFNLLLSSLASREGFSDLELPFCQLWNKQLQFGFKFSETSSLFFPLATGLSFCSSEGINNHDFPAQYFIVKRTPYHWLPKNIRIQFGRINL